MNEVTQELHWECDFSEFIAALEGGTRGASVRAIYFGSDGGATRKLMSRLKRAGDLGCVAAQLFRAQKASSRAKQYRGGIRRGTGDFHSFRDLAYERKEEAIAELCDVLMTNACGMRWGWQVDPVQAHAKWVLYVDLPNGQCSFHSPMRMGGPDYEDDWDGSRASEERIIEFCESVLSAQQE